MCGNDLPLARMAVNEATEAWRTGRLVLLLVPDGDGVRGDLMLAPEHASPAALNALLTQARGLLCLALDDERYRRLGLRRDPVAGIPRNPRAPRESTTIEAANGVTTGISSADRARTIAAAVAPGASPADVRQPGHVPVLLAAEGGVLERAAPVEAAVDLAGLCGTVRAGVVCEVLGPDGELADREQLERSARAWEAVLLPVERLVERLGGPR